GTPGVLLWFFFQAEDGIRDFHVTGVQTCALPICLAAGVSGSPARPCGKPLSPSIPLTGAIRFRVYGMERRFGGIMRRFFRDNDRSEERRVGKECRGLLCAEQYSQHRTTIQLGDCW